MKNVSNFNCYRSKEFAFLATSCLPFLGHLPCLTAFLYRCVKYKIKCALMAWSGSLLVNPTIFHPTTPSFSLHSQSALLNTTTHHTSPAVAVHLFLISNANLHSWTHCSDSYRVNWPARHVVILCFYYQTCE